jgi:preprotein translocase subunit SecD
MKIPFRVWILIAVLFMALLAISPSFKSGVIIKSVEQNSTAFQEGVRQGMIIKSINQETIKNMDAYTTAIGKIPVILNKTKVSILTDKGEFILFLDKPLGITVDNIPRTRIKTGLDLSGGARALVKAEKPLTESELQDLISVTSNRLNVYGISDVSIKAVSDLQGNNFMLVELAGATPQDLKDLIGKQGKFEAKIGNETVFIGGKQDITTVCRNDATCARIETCGASAEGESCRFSFVVTLSPDAAKRHAAITSKLSVNATEYGRYLDQKLDLYLDDKLVDSLLISENLKGQETTQIQIQGSGSGSTQADAFNAAKASMKNLQTILITGSLPYKLEIVKLDTISPVLGKEFLRNIIYLALIVFIIISIVLFMRYRKIKITLATILTMFSEAFITLGIAALINWNLDAPSIAGIIAGMGTGVNDQIVIIDESVSNVSVSISERIKRALFIIFGAFFTIVAAMLPLFWAGAGLLKGFALTTIISVTAGILITRPAFAEILKKLNE